MSKIIAIIGGPGTGKTSVINELKKRGFNTFDEAAREIINKGLNEGETLDEIIRDVKKFQTQIVERQTGQLLSWRKSADASKVLFIDRGVHDTWAYLTYAKVDLGDELREALDSHRYHKVFLLDMLEDYDHNDHIRVEDRKHAEELHRLTEIAYKKYGMDVIKVPAVRVEDRVDHILRIIYD